MIFSAPFRKFWSGSCHARGTGIECITLNGNSIDRMEYRTSQANSCSLEKAPQLHSVSVGTKKRRQLRHSEAMCSLLKGR